MRAAEDDHVQLTAVGGRQFAPGGAEIRRGDLDDAIGLPRLKARRRSVGASGVMPTM